VSKSDTKNKCLKGVLFLIPAMSKGLFKFCWRCHLILLVISSSTTEIYGDEYSSDSTMALDSYQKLAISGHGNQQSLFLNEKLYTNRLSVGINLEFLHLMPVTKDFSFLLGSTAGVGYNRKTNNVVSTTYFILPGILLGSQIKLSKNFNISLYYNLFWERYSVINIPSEDEKFIENIIEGAIFLTPFSLCVRLGWKISDNWEFYNNISYQYAALRNYNNTEQFTPSLKKTTWQISFSFAYIL
jgi:hypothetical protein